MTVEEKLSRLEAAVLADVTAHADELRASTDSAVAEQIAREEAEIAEQEKDRLARETAAINASVSRELSLRQLDAKRQVIAERDKLADGVFAEIAAKLTGFAASPAYREYLSERIEQNRRILSSGHCVLFLRAADKDLIDGLLTEKGFSVQTAAEPGIKLGGFRISAAGRLIDETLDESLAHQRAEFACTSGFIID